MSTIIEGIAGGQHVAGAPLTTESTAQVSPELLRASIDERITRVRPTSTPLDQLSRAAKSRSCQSMKVSYYTSDVRKWETKTNKPSTPTVGEDSTMYVMYVDDTSVFCLSDTVLFPDVMLPGTHSPITGYVLQNEERGGLGVVVPDHQDDMPTIPSGTKVIRMGRAATELDVQTPQYQAVPVKRSNTCQIFKMQVEQSTLQKIADKEVDWGFSDQEEAAVIDMRMGMEKNFLFGRGMCYFNGVKNENVYTTEGIWHQAGGDFEIDLDTVSEADLIELSTRTFTGNSGSKRKILMAGTGMLEALSKINVNVCRMAPNKLVRWGIEFSEITTNFGTLYVVHSEVFDTCGHANDGIIIDPDYLTKYTHIPFTTESLDLRRSGQRNTEAVVLTEASCLVLRYPQSHLRLIGKKS